MDTQKLIAERTRLYEVFFAVAKQASFHAGTPTGRGWTRRLEQIEEEIQAVEQDIARSRSGRQ